MVTTIKYTLDSQHKRAEKIFQETDLSLSSPSIK